MNTPSEGMLAQRQLRAAEIALETARQRRRETDAQLRELEVELEAARSEAVESRAARERDRVELDEQLRLARVRQAGAEQRYVEERNLRLNLEQQLSALRREELRRDDLAHQLAAEARIRELEGELELVTKRAAAFEYGVRMAAFDAFKLVREMADVVTGLLSKTGLVEVPRPDARAAPAGGVEPAGSEAGGPVEPAAAEPLAPAEPAGASDPVSAPESMGAAERVSAAEPGAAAPGTVRQPQPISELLPPVVRRTVDPPSGSRRALETFRRIPAPRRAIETLEVPDPKRAAELARKQAEARGPEALVEPAPEPYTPPARPRDRDALRPPSVADVLDSHKLDAALDRLRATTPPPQDDR